MKLFLESGNRTHGERVTLAVVAHVARATAVDERVVGIVLRVGVGFARPADSRCGFAADLLERFVEATEPGVVHFNCFMPGRAAEALAVFGGSFLCALEIESAR